MTSRLRGYVSIVAVAVLATTLAGCGGRGETAGTASTVTSKPEPTVDAAVVAKVEAALRSADAAVVAKVEAALRSADAVVSSGDAAVSQDG